MSSVNEFKDVLFGVPIWGMYFNNLKDEVDDYIKYLYDLKEINPSNNKSGFTGYQTVDDIHVLDLFKNLVSSIDKVANDIVKDFEDRIKYDVEVTSMWGNINNRYAGNFPHIHSGDLSGVFYLKVPYNSGDIVFINPAQRSESHRIRVPNYGVQPQELACFIFPSWLEHYVKPNESEKDRISISFNIQEVR